MNTTTTSNPTDFEAVTELLNSYFQGLYDGDVDSLREVFHDDAWLKGYGYRKTRDEWLEVVANRAIPRDEGMDWNFRILSLDIVDDQAMAKLDVPMLTARSVDFLSLLKESDEWKVVNKLFTFV